MHGTLKSLDDSALSAVEGSNEEEALSSAAGTKFRPSVDAIEEPSKVLLDAEAAEQVKALPL